MASNEEARLAKYLNKDAEKKPFPPAKTETKKVVRDITPPSKIEQELCSQAKSIQPVSIHSSQITQVDTELCPPIGDASEINAKEDERLQHHILSKSKNVDMNKLKQEQEEARKKEEHQKMAMAKLEARRKQHEQKLVTLEGDLPDWMKAHKAKEEQGEHLKKTEVVEYIVTDTTKRDVPPALQS
eukprot:TRINITY_DN11744_c0_g1_i1.p1 TRINITY_DN11744_c0_g1~~TRINITY_DN11744_c0_g1_i1.p1  ORF type:complete len:201 (-),score=53.07 TRINITY_DN11744_c0_g1_i1:91-645(-)